jgi:hypothetical protein
MFFYSWHISSIRIEPNFWLQLAWNLMVVFNSTTKKCENTVLSVHNYFWKEYGRHNIDLWQFECEHDVDRCLDTFIYIREMCCERTRAGLYML